MSETEPEMQLLNGEILGIVGMWSSIQLTENAQNNIMSNCKQLGASRR
jgi:hypothetical protein